MFKHIRLKNLRAFKDTQEIELNPLTVLVGKNSSGKSTIARTLPLLRQSVEVSTRGPILWFGNKYVDFGSFETAVNTNTNDKFITFEIGLSSEKSMLQNWYRARSKTQGNREELNVSLTVYEENKSTKLHSVKMENDELLIEVKKHGRKGKIFINGIEVPKFFVSLDNSIDYGLLPDVALASERSNAINRAFFEELAELKKSIITQFLDNPALNLDKNERVRRYFIEILDFTEIHFDAYKEGLEFEAKSLNVVDMLSSWDEEFVRHLWHQSLMLNVPSLVMTVNNILHEQMQNVTYVAPVRAIAERYYRFQDLQVKELDHTGSNLAMLLLSLNDKQFRDFKKWIKENLKFEVSVEPSGEHYEVTVKPEGYNNFHNLSDMGFGFSQILPVVVSIWMGTLPKKRPGRYFESRNLLDRIIVIEQPELHLHPEMQSTLARTIVSVAANYDKLRIKFLIETHSKTLIDSIGRCIREEIIESNAISINIVEHIAASDTSVVSKAKFDDKGRLNNWPIGFFSV